MGGKHIGAKDSYFIGELCNFPGKPWAFCTGDPFNGDPVRINADVFKQQFNYSNTGQCFLITIQVMTFAGVSPHDHDAVSPFFEGGQHKLRMNHSRAHDPDGFHVGWICQPGYAGKITARIRAPVAQKSNDRGFKCIFHLM